MKKTVDERLIKRKMREEKEEMKDRMIKKKERKERTEKKWKRE